MAPVVSLSSLPTVKRRRGLGTKSITHFLPSGSDEVEIYPFNLLTKYTPLL